HLGGTDEGLGHLVTSDPPLTDGGEFAIGRSRPVDQLHYRHDLTAPPMRGSSDDDDVVDVGVGCNGALDFFDEDLLTAGVDGDRVATEELYPPVGQQVCPV